MTLRSLYSLRSTYSDFSISAALAMDRTVKAVLLDVNVAEMGLGISPDPSAVAGFIPSTGKFCGLARHVTRDNLQDSLPTSKENFIDHTEDQSALASCTRTVASDGPKPSTVEARDHFSSMLHPRAYHRSGCAAHLHARQ